MHCTIMDRARSIRSNLNLPANLWGECVLTSTYMKNRTLSRSLKGKTPFEAYYGKKPDLTHLRELGCREFVLKQGINPKIYYRSVECILIGYSPNSKAYRCYHRESWRVHTSRDVCFIKSQDTMSRPTTHNVINANTNPKGEDEDDMTDTLDNVPDEALEGLANPDPLHKDRVQATLQCRYMNLVIQSILTPHPHNGLISISPSQNGAPP